MAGTYGTAGGSTWATTGGGGSTGPTSTAGVYTGDGRGGGGTTYTSKSTGQTRNGSASYQDSYYGGGSYGGGSSYYGYQRVVPHVDVPAEEKDLILQTFRKWDVAGNNYITRKELANVLASLGVETKIAYSMFDQADFNKDGKIEYKEFVYWLYQGKAPKAVKDKALAPAFKVVVEELIVELPDKKATPFVRWRDLFTKQIIAQSPSGPVAPNKIDLCEAKRAPLVFDIPSDLRAVGVEVCIAGKLWGETVVGSAELCLGPVAKAMASGFGRVQSLEVSVNSQSKPKPGQKPDEVGKVLMSLTETTEGGALWAQKIVQEWKKTGLPELPTFVEVKGVMETLVIEPDPLLESTVATQADKLTWPALEAFEKWTPEEAEKELDTLADALLMLKNVARKSTSVHDNMSRPLAQTRSNVLTKIIDTVLKPEEPNYRMLKLSLKLANRLDSGHNDVFRLEKVFKEVLKFPDNARMDDLMAAPDADLVQLQPKDLGLTLASDNEQPPKCDDHTRFQVRDATAERVLKALGCSDRLHYTLGLTYEKMAIETISEPAFKVPEQVAALLKQIHLFRGEPDAGALSLAQHMAARSRDWEALIGRFDIVAQPVVAEYDKDFRPIGPTAELPSGFFGEPAPPNSNAAADADGKSAEPAAQKIGGKGWFWVLHAAAMNIGESARAEDFQEYSIEADTKYKGNWASQRALDETKYLLDMTQLWRRSLEAAVHLGIQDIVMFPFGMGAFLRNLHQLDGYYSEPEPRRRLRKGVAKGLFISLAELMRAGQSMRVHVCLVDTGLEARVNHNVFIEAAAELVKEIPTMSAFVQFHRNCDALELARSLAATEGPADKVRPVGMLNGANNKLLGNHWFAQGARSAIDENLHRRSGSMCIGSLLMNMGTSPQDRSIQELAKNVKLLGGQVVDLKPYPVALGPSRQIGRIYARINVKSYGVLGMQLLNGKPVRAGPDPDAGTAIVDPTASQNIQKGPGGGVGPSLDIYRWLGIENEKQFPDEVKAAVKEAGQAKIYSYKEKLCIHAIGPNLREGRRCTREQAVKELSEAYAYIMVEFGQNSAARTLRLLPLCSLSGPFAADLPLMDAEALGAAFGMLTAEYQDRILKTNGIELCVYSAQDVPAYAHAFRQLN